MEEKNCDSWTVEYSIIVPVYNSSGIIPILVDKVITVMDYLKKPYEIILVEDCSPDNSWDAIKKICKQIPNIRGLRLSNNYGQWMATMAGIRESKGKLIITIDDDLEYDPQDIISLIECIQSSDFKLVFGIAPNKYLLQGKSNIFNDWRNKIVNFLLGKYVTDSFKIFKRELLFTRTNIFIPNIHFEAYINHTLHKKYVGYMNVNFHKRYSGNSSYNFFKKTKLIYKHSIEYHKNLPELSFLLLSIILITGICVSFLQENIVPFLITISFSLTLLLVLLLKYVASIYISSAQIPDYHVIEYL